MTPDEQTLMQRVVERLWDDGPSQQRGISAISHYLNAIEHGQLAQLSIDRHQAAERALVAAGPFYCPSCRKRVSALHDTLSPVRDPVQFVCNHCDHHFDVPRPVPA